MAPTTIINGQAVELGQTRPDGLAIGSFNAQHRKLIQWNVPNRGLVEMYVNPESMSISEGKIIKEVRTKGGYVVQYWGEKLTVISLIGTTGSSGIEGINILRDVYRQEQVNFGDIISQLNTNFLGNLFQTTIGAIQNLSNNPLSNPSSIANTVSNPSQLLSSVSGIVNNVANVFDAIGSSISASQELIPTLGALATSVELWYDGWQFRGFFTEFRVDEKATELGLFKYDIKFTVTRRLGVRTNGFAWQRSPDFGGANSDTVPLTFGALAAPVGGGQIATAPGVTIAPPPVSRRSGLTGG